MLTEEAFALRERKRMRQSFSYAIETGAGKADQRMFHMTNRLADDGQVVVVKQIVGAMHRSGDRVFHRNNAVTGCAVIDRLEHVLQPAAWHQLCMRGQ